MIRVNGEPLPEAAIRFELDRLVRFYREHLPAEQLNAQMDTLRRRAREQAIGAKLRRSRARGQSGKCHTGARADAETG